MDGASAAVAFLVLVDFGVVVVVVVFVEIFGVAAVVQLNET